MENLLHTPEGVRDIYNEECSRKNVLSAKLGRILNLYGYRDIQTPTFEFFDIFNRERGTVPSRNMYKFIDRDGSTLVLRPDITPSIARAVAKYYKEERIPLRFSYCGNTFINNSSLQGKMKETTQLGAELIGDRSIEGDAEIVALAINLLLESGLENFQLDVGHVGFFQALAREASMDKSTVEQMRVLIESKNYFGVEALLEQLTLPKETADIFLKLPELFGAYDVIEQARAMTKNEEALKALDAIEKLYQLIREYGFEKYITIDLGMLTEYDYYTGIIFRGYTYGTGDAVVKGGRYDHLIGQFGKDAASVGFAVVLDELMLALSRQKIDIPTGDAATMVLYEPEFRSQAIRTANSLRNINRSVSMLKKESGMDMGDYKDYCRRYHMESILYVNSAKTLMKLDIADDSVRTMPVPE
ncbi:MAG: ATP phosphoribosyltransferase regulatory subunit [Coprococcus sp.]